jgi:hypothetical protein
MQRTINIRGTGLAIRTTALDGSDQALYCKFSTIRSGGTIEKRDEESTKRRGSFRRHQATNFTKDDVFV